MSIFLFKRWQLRKKIEIWQPFQRKHKRSILGTAGHDTRSFLDSKRGRYNTGFRGNWRQGHWKIVPGTQQDKVPRFACAVWIRENSLEPTGRDELRKHSENIQEHRHRKPGTKLASFPEGSSSWGGNLSLSVHHSIDSDSREAFHTWHVNKELWNVFSQNNFVFSDKINLVVFWTYANRLVFNWLFEEYLFSVEEK